MNHTMEMTKTATAMTPATIPPMRGPVLDELSVSVLLPRVLVALEALEVRVREFVMTTVALSTCV
jgi:hypothetical protein